MQFLRKKAARPAAFLCAVLAVIVLACAVYLGDYYPADPEQIQAFSAQFHVEPVRLENGNYILAPEGADTGLIFYPGGKVAHEAYLPLMEALASRGILCVLVQMPFRLAVLDADAAQGIPEQYPQITNWYIGGHSLGGSMAAAFLSESADAFSGLILLGSYSTADLSKSDLSVLSVFGSEDRVMNREKYLANKENLPDDFTEFIITGGCHAYFGMYGLQDGDGTPAITNEEQILLTADAIVSLIGTAGS